MMKRCSQGAAGNGQSIKIRLAAAANLLILSAILMIAAARIPKFAEWYSENIYPLFVNSLGRLWGLCMGWQRNFLR